MLTVYAFSGKRYHWDSRLNGIVVGDRGLIRAPFTIKNCSSLAIGSVEGFTEMLDRDLAESALREAHRWLENKRILSETWEECEKDRRLLRAREEFDKSRGFESKEYGEQADEDDASIRTSSPLRLKNENLFPAMENLSRGRGSTVPVSHRSSTEPPAPIFRCPTLESTGALVTRAPDGQDYPRIFDRLQTVHKSESNARDSEVHNKRPCPGKD